MIGGQRLGPIAINGFPFQAASSRNLRAVLFNYEPSNCKIRSIHVEAIPFEPIHLCNTFMARCQAMGSTRPPLAVESVLRSGYRSCRADVLVDIRHPPRTPEQTLIQRCDISSWLDCVMGHHSTIFGYPGMVLA